jgi:hypothetical protein
MGRQTAPIVFFGYNVDLNAGVLMGLRCCTYLGLILLGLIYPSNSRADEIVMSTGDRFYSSKVWEENGKIRFNMNGLVVSVNKSDVAAVIGSSGTPPSGAGNLQMNQSHRRTQPAAATKAKPTTKADPAPPSPAPKQKLLPQEKPKTNVRGIGFNGIAWHMSPADLPGIEKLNTDPAYGGVDQYWRPDGAMTLGNVLLDGLMFGFWQNRLYTILMWVDGRGGYDRLQKVVLERYGAGQKSKNHQDRYVWVDDRTTDRMLEFDAERNIGFFWMRSRELDSHMKRAYPQS